MAALSATTILTNRIRMALVPRAVLEIKMQVSYELKQSQSRLFHELPSGLKMEVIFQKGRIDKDEKSQNPPLVFIHGSFHAAWCWAEHFLPFFCKHGYDCYALSLLGQGESDAPSGAVAGSLQTHANDIADFIQKQINFPPVLLGHSFGGLIVQYYIANIGNEKLHELWLYSNAIEPELCSAIIHGPRISIEILPYLDLILEKEGLHPYLAGAVLVCSVPPSGNSGIVWRYLFSKPVAAFKITRSLAAKAFQTSLPLCKETFFSAEMENQVVLRYQKLMTESSRMPLFDLRKLNASLPTPPVKDSSIKVLVLGAQDDFIVDGKGLEETATFYGVSPVCIEGVAHDIMLDCSWEKGAQVILSWLNHLKR